VCGLAVCIELRLQGFLVLLAIWPVARAMGTERCGRAGGTAGFDGDVRKPFGNAYRRFLHGTWVSTFIESTLLANVIGPRAPVCRPRPTRRSLAGKRVPDSQEVHQETEPHRLGEWYQKSERASTDAGVELTHHGRGDAGTRNKFFRRSYCPVKNSVMSGAVPARPGNLSTPDAASTRRNVLWCWYSACD
jgi:hypothetical protein